ncbi:MAG: hypothetical protein ABEH86_07865 [Haloarcula sp.]
MRVTPEGTVEALRLVFDAERSGKQVQVTQDIRVTNVGSTTVRKPDWVANTTKRSTR